MLPVLAAALALSLDPLEVPAERDEALKLEIVRPFLPGKNRVRWWAFDWRWATLKPDPAGAPIRLYFYEQERPVAERARVVIEDAYRRLEGELGHALTREVPLLLYNSHLEFQTTQAFDISEHVLGVTNVEHLTLAVPYWGEHRRFEQVLTHELGHVFSVDLAMSRAVAAGAGCNPVQMMPLWFVEGLAQHLALPELTAEVRSVLTDERLRGKLVSFFAQGPLDFERIYVVGHAQLHFLDTDIGAGTVRRLLEASPRLCTGGPFSAPPSFAGFVAAVTGVGAEEIQRRWLAFVDRIVAPARESPQPWKVTHRAAGFEDVDSFDLAPDGRTVLYRTMDRDSGVGRLSIRDLDDEEGAHLITRDQRIGLTSLHPVGRPVTAIAEGRLAYIGLVHDSDVIFVRTWERDGAEHPRFHLGPVIRHDVSDLCEKVPGEEQCRPGHLIEAGHPSFDPRTGALAFVGLSRATGALDVFRLDDPLSRDDPGFHRLTDDPYAEQGPRYTSDGRLIYASDATPDGHYELAMLEGGRPVILTDFPGDVDVLQPAPDREGGIVFQTDATGRVQAYRLRAGAVTRITGVPTSWEQPALAEGGRLAGLMRQGGRVRLATLANADLLAEPVQAAPAAVEGGAPEAAPGSPQPERLPPPWAVPRAPIQGDVKYGALSHLHLESAFLAASTGPAILGSVVFSDLFSDVVIGASAEVFNELDQSQLELFYLDGTRHLGYGGVGFVRSDLQLEPGVRSFSRTFLLQRAGAGLLLEYPLDRYLRLSTTISPEAVRAHDFSRPFAAFARETEGTFPAVGAAAAVALDTTRATIVGPYQGVGATVRGEGTVPITGPGLFGSVRLELQGFQNLIAGYPRFFLRGRLAGGTAGGESLAEQFYLPASQNLRAIPEGSILLYGEHYYVGQLELHFPLSPIMGGFFWLQGLAGTEVGGTAFGDESPWERRVAAGVLGTSVGLGPLVLQFLFARPVDIRGLRIDYHRWVFHLVVATPFGAF